MKTRGYIGKRGAGYEIGFTRAGVDYFSAAAKDFIFRTDIETLRPMLMGAVSIPNGQAAIVGLTKTFTQLPWVIAMADYGGSLRLPDGTWKLMLYFNDNQFRIQNDTGAARVFRYAVYDNDQGQISLT